MNTPPMPEFKHNYGFHIEELAAWGKQGWAEAERLEANWKDAEAQLTETESRLNRDNRALRAQAAELADALGQIANEPAVMGPDGHWCKKIARAALSRYKEGNK